MILSLVAPTIVFIITFKLKKVLKSISAAASSNFNEDQNSEQPPNSGHGQIEGSSSERAEHATVDIEHPTVNTPLLAKLE